MKYIAKSMKEIIIFYLIEYLVIILLSIFYQLQGYKNFNYFIINYLPIILLIINIFITVYLTKKYHINLEIIPINKIYKLISIGIVTSCIYNMIIFKIVKINTINNIPIIINILSTGIIGPILEEILFRQILLNNLTKKYTIKKAILINSIIFSIMHLNIIKIIYTLILGTILNISYIKNKNKLIYPIIIHISANTISIFLNNYNRNILIISIILLVIIIKRLKKEGILWHQ